MSFTFALLLILGGLGIMTFGLFLFYAWLPLLYAFVGFDIGLLIARTLTGEVGVVSILFGGAGAVLLAAASYFLEPYRRLLIGVSSGVLFGLAVPGALGLDGWFGGFFGSVMALVCGVIGGLVVPLFFDVFIVATSAVSGAALVMIGAHHILPDVGLFDRAAGGVLPALLALVLAVAGGAWQYSNIAKWMRIVPTGRDGSAAAVEQHKAPPHP